MTGYVIVTNNTVNNNSVSYLLLLLCRCVFSILVIFLIFFIEMRLTNEEAFDMIAVYFECMRNATIASRVYAVQFPERRHYRSGIFRRLINRLKTTGNINLPVYTRRGRGRSEENIINVLGYVAFDPHVGTRTLASQLGIARTTVRNILRDNR